MNIHEQHFTLNNQIEIPKIGLGTWFIDNETAPEAVKAAIKLGYRHIDTAQAYQNEEGVGKGVADCGVARENIFITTKLAAEMKTYDEAAAAIEGSLQTMNLEYIDLMLIHSPKPWANFLEDDPYYEGNVAAWRALEDAYKSGKLKSIGVSNFEEADLKNLMDNCEVKPMVNQILAHITNVPKELISFCKEHNIQIQAYSPMAHGELFKNQDVVDMAKKYEVSIAQLAIKFCLQLDLLPLPKTANPDHMANNADLSFAISNDDMQSLLAMEKIENYGEASIFPVYAK